MENTKYPADVFMPAVKRGASRRPTSRDVFSVEQIDCGNWRSQFPERFAQENSPLVSYWDLIPAWKFQMRLGLANAKVVSLDDTT